MLFQSNKKNIAYQDNIAAELVQLLYTQAKPAIMGSLIVASFLVYSLYHVVPNKLLFAWFGIMILVGVMRFGLVKYYLKHNPPPETRQKWKYIFIATAAIAGAVWSLVGIFLIPDSYIHQTFIACALAGVSAGAVPYYAGSRLSCCLFVIPILGTFAIWSLAQGTTQNELLAFLTMLYLGLLLISCFRTHEAIYSAIKLKFVNHELVKNLTEAKNEMAVINKELKTEISERKMIENLLRESEEQYRLVTDALPVLISYIDPSLHYRFNNKAHEEWFNKKLANITDQPVKDILNPSAYAIFEEHYQKIHGKTPATFETIMQFGDAEERYVSVSLIPHIKDGVMHGLFSLISDMTPRINYLATHDSLTDLPNRSLFSAKFLQAVNRAQRFNSQVALLFLDLDHFKNINDTLGHDVGDQLLIKVAERVKHCLRESDTLARLGGDEFIIILEDVMDNQAIVSVANKICGSFSLPFNLNNRDIFVTTSIGISVYPQDGTELQVVLKNADMAIYQAKELGRNTFQFYTNEMNDQLLKRSTMENNLRAALENKELLIYYQPVLDIAKNKIISFEALLRWRHPSSGFVSPSEFIPVAEEAGLILPIGEWIFRSVCDQAQIWDKGKSFGKDIKLAINLSARHFKENNLIEIITNALKDSGISGESINIELTESLIMHDTTKNLATIKALKDLGMTISIDDFGTGYSSLSYLRKFPIDTIKVDRSFITDIRCSENSEDSEAIVTAIIAMAHGLKMRVIAEGVETLEQYAFLRERGCDEIQGYLISPAVPANEVSKSLSSEKDMIEYYKLHRFKDFGSQYVTEK